MHRVDQCINRHSHGQALIAEPESFGFVRQISAAIYEPAAGEISNILRAPAGYRKLAVLEELECKLQIIPDHTIYVGDGSFQP